VYDLRTNRHFTLKQNPLTRDALDDFVTCYAPGRPRSERAETERFRAFTYDELVARDKANLDVTWLRDESLEDLDNLPAPEVIAREIVEDLTAALAEFEAVAAAPGGVLRPKSTLRTPRYRLLPGQPASADAVVRARAPSTAASRCNEPVANKVAARPVRRKRIRDAGPAGPCGASAVRQLSPWPPQPSPRVRSCGPRLWRLASRLVEPCPQQADEPCDSFDLP
jgi:hypothetical protein